MKKAFLLILTPCIICLAIASPKNNLSYIQQETGSTIDNLKNEEENLLTSLAPEDLAVISSSINTIPEVISTLNPPLCQPFNIQATQIKPNQKCDNGIDNGVAEAGMIPLTPIPADNKVGDWRFDGGLEDSDPAGGNSRLKAHPKKNGPLFIPSNSGMSVELDGVDDYLAMTGPQYSLNNYERVTISTWMQTSSADEMVLVSYDDNEYWELRINSSGKVEWVVNTNAGQAILTSNRVVNEGVWHHIVASFDLGLMSIYIDGKLDAQMTQGSKYGSGISRYGTIGVGSESEKVEGNIDNNSGFYDGNLDEIKLYDSALNPEQVLDVYYSGTPYEPVSIDDLTFRWYAGTDTSVPPVASGIQAQNLAEGTYTVIAEDQLTGCFSNPVQVTIDRLTPTFTAVVWETSSYTTCNAPNGELQAGVVVGSDTITNGYDFVWYETDFLLVGDTVSINNTASNLSSKSYSVLITNSLTGCDTIISMPVTSNISLPLVTAQVTQHIISCSNPNSGSVSASVGGNTSDYYFTWYPEGGNAPIAYTSTASGLAAGRYSVVASDKANGCDSAPATVEIENQSSAPVITSAVTDQSSCNINAPNGSLSAEANVNGTPTTSGYSFFWYKGLNKIIPAKNGYSGGPDVSGLPAGNYRVVVTNNGTGCSTFQDVTINEAITSPSLSLESQSNILQCGTTGGSAIVSLNDDPEDFDVYWFKGSMSTPDTTNTSSIINNGLTANALAEGSYTVYAAHKINRCLSNAVNLTITDETVTPIVNTEVLATQTSCIPSEPNGILRASVDASAYGGSDADTLGYTFEWYDGAFTATNLPGTPIANQATVKNLPAGEYTVKVTDPSNACSNINYINLTSNLLYPNFDVATVTQPSTCAEPWGSSIAVSVNGGLTEADGFSFTWTDLNNATTLAETSATINNLAPGDYQVFATSPVGCTSAPLKFTLNEVTNPFSIDVNEVQPQSACPPMAPNGQLQALVGGTDSGYSFEWFAGAISLTDAASAAPIAFTSTASQLAVGEYTVVVTDQASSCQQIAYASVTENIQNPVLDNNASVTQPNTCAEPWGSSIAVSVNGGLTEADGFSFTWTDLNNATTLAETSATINNLAPGDYQVFATSPVGCTSAPLKFTLTDNSIPPALNLDAFNNTSCNSTNANGVIEANGFGGSASDYSFEWFVNDTSGSKISSNISADGSRVSGLRSGTYALRLTDIVTKCTTVEYANIINSPEPIPVVDTVSTTLASLCNAGTQHGEVVLSVAGGFKMVPGTSGIKKDYTFNLNGPSGYSNSKTSNSEVTFLNLNPGNYTATITDTNSGCTSDPLSFVILQKPLKNINISYTKPTSCGTVGFSDGEASIEVATDTNNPSIAGSPGFTFDWIYEVTRTAFRNGSDTKFKSYRELLGPGYYGINITDLETGCTYYERFLLKIAQPPTVSIDNTIDLSNCAIDNGEVTFTLDAGPSGNPLDNYVVNLFKGEKVGVTPIATWSPAFSTTDLQHSFNNLDTGKYLIAVQINVSPFCYVADKTFEIGENIPEANISFVKTDDTSCDGSGNGSITASVVGTDGNTNYTLNWYNSTNPLLPFASGSSINNLTPDIYRLEVIDNFGSGLSCTFDTSLVIINNPIDVKITTSKTDILGCRTVDLGTAYISSITENGSPANFADYTALILDANNKPIAASGSGTSASPFTDLSAGIYYLAAKHNATGCMSNLSQVNIQNLSKMPQVSLTQLKPDYGCTDPALATGILVANPRGPADNDTDLANFSFQWFTGQDDTNPANEITANLSGTNNQQANKLAAGWYTVLITDISGNGNACTVSSSFQLQPVAPAISLTASASNPDACGGEGAITVNSITVNNTDAPPTTMTDFNLLLLDGNGALLQSIDAASTSTFNNLAVGNYRVLAQHKNYSCWPANKVGVSVIDDNLAPDILLTNLTNDLNCTGVDPSGSITVSAVGPNDGNATDFDFKWYEGENIDPASLLDAGNIDPTNPARAIKLISGVYTVEVMDNNIPALGCSSKRTFKVGEISLSIDIDIKATDQLSCLEGGSAYVNQVLISNMSSGSSVGNPDNFTYELLDNSLNVLTNTGNGKANSPFTELSTGKYYIRATQVIGSNCSSSLSAFTISDKSTAPIVSIQKDSDQFSNNVDLSSWTGALSAVVTESASNPLASGNTFTYNYAWFTEDEYPSGNSFSDQPNVSGLDKGLYFVLVTNNITGCTAVANYFVPKVIIPPVTQFAITVPLTCWNDATIELTQLLQNGKNADPNDFEFRLYQNEYPSNLISTVTSPSTNMLFEELGEGSYYVSVYNRKLNIEGDLSQLQIEKNATGPIVKLDVTKYQAQQSCDENFPNGVLAVETYEADYSIDNYTYQWYTGKAISPANIISGATEKTLTGLAQGFYTVDVNNSNTGCSSIATFYVNEESNTPVISASSSDNSFCNETQYNGSVSARVTFANGRELSANNSSGYRFEWYKGQTVTETSFASGKTLNNLAPGYYTVVATDMTNGNCISETATVRIKDVSNTDQVEIVQENPQENCDPQLVNGSLSATINNGTSGYSFRWYNADGELISNSYIAEHLKAGRYKVEAINQITGCVIEAQGSVEEKIQAISSPSVQINNHQTSCDAPDGAVTAMIPTLINDYAFFWYDAFGNLLPVQEATGKLSGLSAGKYSLQLLELRSGCRTEVIDFEIRDKTFHPIFRVYTEPAICEEKSGLIRIIPADINNIDRVEWYTIYGKEILGERMEVSEMHAGDYHYKVYGKNGCFVEGRVTIEADINVFNGVSPNGDGDNDYFHIDCLEKFTGNNVKIFNRAGALVYEADYYDNMAAFFEGRGNRGLYIGGKDLPAGTYFYVIDKRDNISKPKTGYLELTW